VNYLSLLGWSSPSGEEVLSRERLVREVTLDRVGAADVVYDPNKLRWMSARHIDAMDLAEVADATREIARDAGYGDLLDDRYPRVLAAVRTHLSAFSEIVDHLAPFAGRLDPAGRERVQRLASEPGVLPVLHAVRRHLTGLDRWDAEGLKAGLRDAGRAAGVKGRDLYGPVRIALTGEEQGPPLLAIMEAQGRERVLAGLERAERSQHATEPGEPLV
jgi:glutamyl/glutaminyl-tRNA synthetase